MSTERRQREGLLDRDGEQDPLVKALEGTLYKCRDELRGQVCDCCPVKRKCERLWPEEVEEADGRKRNLSLTEYRRLAYKFASLKQERDCVLAKREVLLNTHKATVNTLSHR